MLTPEERDELWEEYEKKGYNQKTSFEEVLIKAQAKKIMDKVETELRKFTCATGKEIADSLWWQALLKEVLGE